jgi:tricarballylate dehydrogenase
MRVVPKESVRVKSAVTRIERREGRFAVHLEDSEPIETRAVTLACPDEALGTQESQFLAALDMVETWSLTGDQLTLHGPGGTIMVNANGERFVDEGADFRNFTYAKYGHVVQQQPGMFAWQVFDQKVEHLLRDEYRIRQVTKVTANTLQELAGKLEGVDPKAFLATVTEYNRAVQTDVPFSPVVKDGRGTTGLRIPKTNWANTIDTPPFQAYAVACGVTFTFGGVKISPDTNVQNVGGRNIPGLFAAGEMVGGLFYFNYPSGSGLVSGAVFGRRAGTSAARYARGAG